MPQNPYYIVIAIHWTNNDNDKCINHICVIIQGNKDMKIEYT